MISECIWTLDSKLEEPNLHAIEKTRHKPSAAHRLLDNEQFDLFLNMEKSQYDSNPAQYNTQTYTFFSAYCLKFKE